MDHSLTYFKYSNGVAVDSEGNIYVSNAGNRNAICKISCKGVATNLKNLRTNFERVHNKFQSFNSPGGVAVGGDGRVYVADRRNNLVREIDDINSNVTNLGKNFVSKVNPTFKYPSGVAVDSSRNVYVADTKRNLLRKIDAKTGNVTKLGKIFLDTDHPSFKTPIGIAIDSSRNVYVADTGNNLVRKIDTKGVVTNLGNKSFKHPNGVAVDSQGNVYVADTGNKLVRKIDTDGVVTNLGIVFKDSSGGEVNLDNQGQDMDGEPFFGEPVGVAVDTLGNVYVTDTMKTNFLGKIDAKGNITNLHYTFFIPSDGTQYLWTSVAVDSLGNVYAANPRNNSIFKLDAKTGAVTNLGKFLNLNNIIIFADIAIDSAGNVYVVDVGNNLLSKIDAKTSNVTTVY
jgi:sugar lactone lactonase YvrE